ncbi:MAG: DsbA family protein, partial [Candidatus Promineifilaceae bacterium]
MSGTKWSARIGLSLLILALTIAVLAACGPAGGSIGDTEMESGSPETGESLLSNEEPVAQDALSTPASQAEEQNETEDLGEAGSGIAENEGDGIILASDSSEYDEGGLPVGFTEDGHAYRGDPGAPVVIQEYSDYQCPFCSRFYMQTLPSLLENQIAGGDAVLIYYDFPLANIHPQASAAANAARCAGEQGAAAYWAMHDTLFSRPEEWAVTDSATVFVSYAEELTLDIEVFESCVAENRYAAEIQADLASGQSQGVTGTPTFFINGQKLVGAQPLDSFVSAIDTVKSGGQIASDEPPQQAPAAAPTPAAFADDFAGAMGDPDAPVTIVEFTDYQCPYCSQHSLQTLPSIVSELVDTGRVYYILKDLPLDQLHPDARAAAEAARCAGDQGAYWAMHDALFANQSEWAGQGDAATALFVDYAAELGLDDAEMTACLESSRFEDAVAANVAEARTLGISGTPMFFVDGYPLNGARPFEHFQLAVQYAEEGILADAYAPQEQQAQQPSAPPTPADIEIGDAFVLGD